MFADAFRSEAYRLLRNRTTVFWAFLFVPLAALVASVAQTLFVHSQTSKITRGLPDLNLLGGDALNLGDALLKSAAGLSNPAILLFTLIAAATLFAGDYRWETWRLISARNSRVNLVLGKIAVLAAGVGLALLIYLASPLIGKAIEGLMFGRNLTFSLSGDGLVQTAALAGLAWLSVMQFLMISLLAAVVTRSLLAALFIPLVIVAGQAILSGVASGIGLAPDSWLVALLFPGVDADLLRTMLLERPAGAEIQPIRAWAGLALWIMWPVAAAVAWFQRQNLSKE